MNSVTLCLVSLAAAALAAESAANAAITVNITQVGSNVETQFAGSFNLNGLSYGGLATMPTVVRGNLAFYSGVSGIHRGWAGVTGPASIGTGASLISATSAFGDMFVFSTGSQGNSFIGFSLSYNSGAPISGGTIFAGQSLATLGLTPGTYVYSGPNDTLTFNISAGRVPEPASWALLVLGFGLMGATLRGQRAPQPALARA